VVDERGLKEGEDLGCRFQECLKPRFVHSLQVLADMIDDIPQHRLKVLGMNLRICRVSASCPCSYLLFQECDGTPFFGPFEPPPKDNHPQLFGNLRNLDRE